MPWHDTCLAVDVRTRPLVGRREPWLDFLRLVGWFVIEDCYPSGSCVLQVSDFRSLDSVSESVDSEGGLRNPFQVSSLLSIKADGGRWGGQWSREELRGIPQHRFSGTTQFPILVPPVQRVQVRRVLALKAAWLASLASPSVPIGALGFWAIVEPLLRPLLIN